jgi:serine/threonine protein kinase
MTSQKPQETGITLQSTSEASKYRFEDSYKLIKKLSKGSFGIVYSSQHIGTKAEYAVKVIERAELNQKETVNVEKEVSILHDFRGVRNIVQLVDFFVSPERYYVVQQLAEGGDVFERLAQRASYNEKDARDLAVHLLEAIDVLHSRKLAHRDLKPENLLLRDMFDDTTILVADFGFAAYVPPEGLKTRCGTPAFVAPQILVPDCRYDERVDMWSVGCLLYMLIAGYPPFQDRNHRGLFRKVRGADFVFHDKYWKNVSKSAKQLISCMLTIDPRYRCTARMALEKSNWLKMDASLLKEHNLDASLGEIKKFHARRTLKTAIHAVVWTVKYKNKSADDIAFDHDAKGWDFMMNNTKDVKGGQIHQEEDSLQISRLDLENRNDIDDEEFYERTGGKSDTLLLTKLRPSLTFSDIYELTDLLHDGQSSKVYECYHRKTRAIYAVKIIDRNDSIKKSVSGRTLTESILHEVALLDSLNHKNIIQVQEFFEDADKFYLVMERMRGGDVFDRLMKVTRYTERDAKVLAKVLLAAVAHCHQQGIAHR